MSSKTAKRMLEELNASEGLPPFDLNGVQELRAEVERIARDLWHMGAAENTDESEYSTGVRIHVHDSTIARDKRCLLAYMMHRADRIELLYWQGGAVLDPETKKKLSDEEVDYFKGYGELMIDYMEKERVTGLLADYKPPKFDVIQVEALVDCGVVTMNKGGSRRIRPGEMVTLSRSDAEPFIRKNMMRELPRFL